MTYLSFAAASKLIAVAATYPYQLMRTRMQDQHLVSSGAEDILARTWRSTSFWRLHIYSNLNCKNIIGTKESVDSTRGWCPLCSESLPRRPSRSSSTKTCRTFYWNNQLTMQNDCKLAPPALGLVMRLSLRLSCDRFLIIIIMPVA